MADYGWSSFRRHFKINENVEFCFCTNNICVGQCLSIFKHFIYIIYYLAINVMKKSGFAPFKFAISAKSLQLQLQL